MGKVLPFFQRERTESTGKYEKSQVGADSIIGEGTTIADKSVVKRSVIGRNCRIGERVKITNSTVMDNVQITSDSTITSSIIANNCKINAKSEFKDCFVGYNQDIPAGMCLLLLKHYFFKVKNDLLDLE